MTQASSQATPDPEPAGPLAGVRVLDLSRVLAGPSEVAVIADETADPIIVAADLLGQAEHGPESPAALVTTSRTLGLAVIAEVDRQLATLSTRSIAEPAWRDYGSVTWVADTGTAVQLMDELAPEHLEIQTRDAATVAGRISNAGAVFVGPFSPVSLGDYCAGSNHVLPTGGSARLDSDRPYAYRNDGARPCEFVRTVSLAP